MTVAENVRSLSKAARPAIRGWLDAADELKALRDAASEKGINWTALKALLVAQERDANDGGHRVEDLVKKFDMSLTYADMIVSEDRKKTPQSKTEGQSAEHNARSAPVAAAGRGSSGDRGPTAATNSPSVGTPLQGRTSHATGHASQASEPSGVTPANKTETARVDRLEGQDNGAGNNSESAALTAPMPALLPPKPPSGPAAEMAPSVSAATVSEPDDESIPAFLQRPLMCA